jgi:hypothetical protein
MNLEAYPLDEQTFSITIQSFAYATSLVILHPFTKISTITFNTDPSLGDIEYFQLDPIWTFIGWSDSFINQDLGIFWDPYRGYSTASIFLTFQRQSFGIVYRLALPVMIFLFLVGFAFWADLDHRVDITITMVLAVSAFYLVVGQVIPFVGYFSLFDKFITTAFVILSTAAGIHYVVINLDAKKLKYPSNEFFLTVIVYVCRVVWFPSLFTMVYIFYAPVLQMYLIAPTLALFLMTTGVTILHTEELDVKFRKCICRLRVKHYYSRLNLPFLHDEQSVKEDTEKLLTMKLTSFEQFMFNLTIAYEYDCLCDYKLRWDLYEQTHHTCGQRFWNYVGSKLDSMHKLSPAVQPQPTDEENPTVNTNSFHFSFRSNFTSASANLWNLKIPGEAAGTKTMQPTMVADLGYSIHCVLIKEAKDKTDAMRASSKTPRSTRRHDYCNAGNCHYCQTKLAQLYEDDPEESPKRYTLKKVRSTLRRSLSTVSRRPSLVNLKHPMMGASGKNRNVGKSF